MGLIRPFGSHRLVLLSIFFFSGFAALLYQVIWQRLLVFYTGSDTVSISLIVTAFMSGLGLGYLFGGRLADRQSTRRNLIAFIVAETGILLFAVFSKFILYDMLYRMGVVEWGVLSLYAVVFAVLLFPTFLMGISLPVLAKAVHFGDAESNARFVGSLYFTNTLGAAFGAFITGIVLVRVMGYADALWVGVAMNGLCVLCTMVMQQGPDAAIKDPVPQEAAPAANARRMWWWGAQYMLSGMAALSLELIWFRVLGSLIKSVSITFSILLGIYLGSMAVGTWAGNRMGARRTMAGRERLFVGAQVLLYAYVGVSFLLLYHGIGHWGAMDFLAEYFKSYEPDLTPRILLPTYVLIPLFLMFLPTFLMGVSFAVSQLMIHDDPAMLGRRVGWLQFVNIVGSAAGAWGVTWVGFNLFGTAVLLKLITALAIVYAAVAWVRHQRPQWAIGTALFALLGLMAVLPTNGELWMRLGGMSDPGNFLYDEDASGVSVIKRYERKGALVGIVFANGLGQSMIPYRRDVVHSKLGTLPVLLHPHPRTVAVIGLGSSGTLHGTAARKETEHIVCFEIMSNQYKVLRQYAELMKDVAIIRMLEDPRLDLVFHDGRYRLTVDTTRYDVIEADALRPNSAFSGNIYSKEYFQLLLSRLNPGGFAASWCPTPRVLRTAREVFPYSILIDSLVLIGSNAPIGLDIQRTKDLIASDYMKAHFAQADIDIGELLNPMLGKIVSVPMETTPRADINTDLFPRDEFVMPYTWAMIKAKITGVPPPTQ